VPQDDVMAPQRIESQYAAATSSPDNMVGTGTLDPLCLDSIIVIWTVQLSKNYVIWAVVIFV
jgi:hypothetical protein